MPRTMLWGWLLLAPLGDAFTPRALPLLPAGRSGPAATRAKPMPPWPRRAPGCGGGGARGNSALLFRGRSRSMPVVAPLAAHGGGGDLVAKAAEAAMTAADSGDFANIYVVKPIIQAFMALYIDRDGDGQRFDALRAVWEAISVGDVVVIFGLAYLSEPIGRLLHRLAEGSHRRSRNRPAAAPPAAAPAAATQGGGGRSGGGVSGKVRGWAEVAVRVAKQRFFSTPARLPTPWSCSVIGGWALAFRDLGRALELLYAIDLGIILIKALELEGALLTKIPNAAADVVYALWGARSLMRLKRRMLLRSQVSKGELSALATAVPRSSAAPSAPSASASAPSASSAASAAAASAASAASVSVGEGEREPAMSGQAGVYDRLGDITVGFTAVMIGLQCLALEFGVSLSSLLAVGGASGLVVGLALQEPMSHIISGMILTFTDKFRPGDEVNLDNGAITGWCVEVGWIDTRIRGYDEHVNSIPNARVARAAVDNLSRNTHSSYKAELRLRYEDAFKLEAVAQLAKEKLATLPHIILDGGKARPLYSHWTAFGHDAAIIKIEARFDLPEGEEQRALQQAANALVLAAVHESGADFSVEERGHPPLAEAAKDRRNANGQLANGQLPNGQLANGLATAKEGGGGGANGSGGQAVAAAAGSREAAEAEAAGSQEAPGPAVKRMWG